MAQSFSWNGFEATLVSPITAGATTITLDSTVGLRAPGYLVIEPESPTLREYILFSTLNGSTLENVTRGLDGSISGGQAHDAGVKIRAVSVHQMFDDIWAQINAGGQDLTNHLADSGDPHAPAAYLKLATANGLYLHLDGGSTMAGALSMGTNKITGLGDPTQDQDAATQGFVNAGDAAAQDYADAAVGTHTAIADAHHAKYTDGEAAAAAPVQEAPEDGSSYLRQDAGWVEATDVDLSAYYTKSEVDGLIAGLQTQINGKAGTIHQHTAADTNAGVFNLARIPVLDVARIPDLNASKILPGTFGVGVFTFPSGLTVAGTMGVGGGFELPNIAQNVGTHALRINTGSGVVTYN